MLHELKTTPPYFCPVWDGSKPFEIRFDDRAYQSGDQVVLLEWDHALPCSCRDIPRHDHRTCARFTGRSIDATIGHLTSSTPPRGRQPGFDARRYVVFALLGVTCHDAPPAAQGQPEEPQFYAERALCEPARPALAELDREPRPAFATGGRVGPRAPRPLGRTQL